MKSNRNVRKSTTIPFLSLLSTNNISRFDLSTFDNINPTFVNRANEVRHWQPLRHSVKQLRLQQGNREDAINSGGTKDRPSTGQVITGNTSQVGH